MANLIEDVHVAGPQVDAELRGPKELLRDALAVTAEQLTAMTPPDIDTLLAALELYMATHDTAAERAIDSLHRALGERKQATSWNPWPTSDEEAEQKARTLYEANTLRSWDQKTLSATLDRLDGARRKLAASKAPMARINSEFVRRGEWSRFLIVVANGGHIHSSRGCQSIRPTTQTAWIPDMSGRTEADCVAEHGPHLCTICYPSAPLEWTVGEPKPEGCPGTDEKPEGKIRRTYSGNWAACPSCGDTRKLKTNGRLPRHQPAKKD
ncbi:hypothetical protein [Streptomyces sp. NBC_01304]|uniref:hypothetical protein n=1 Tax=Streptomyces sp. NBC_01304 TaxID=2903818 RepID=UPI002E104C9E|nr:hypothetical protein OG430_48820 [Streptomyces sp. NBC_01304]